MTVAAAILAAGAGSRFSGDRHKLLADFRGRPVVAWVIDAVLAAGFDDVYLVTGAVDLDPVVDAVVAEMSATVGGAGPPGVTVVPNPRWREGQSTSLGAAIAAATEAGHDALVVGLGDQPLVSSAAWRTVGAASGQIVTATFDGARRPPVRLDASIWHLVPTEGDEGARTLMKEQPQLVSEVPCMGNPVDIDTLEDLLLWS